MYVFLINYSQRLSKVKLFITNYVASTARLPTCVAHTNES